MATRLADGSIKLNDGRTIFGNTLILGQDLAELVAFLAPPPAWPFVSGGGGGPGTVGPHGPPGPGGGGGGGSGSQGFQGFQGAVAGGPQGAQGPSAVGIQGPQGPAGTQGNQGNVGPQGVGVQGPAGSQGNQGNQGNQGVFGPQGQGVQGPQGTNPGVQGPQGNQGFQGAGGGPQGAQGNQGLQGTNPGVQGPQGNQGFQGAGAQGQQGFQGGPVNAWVQGGNSFGATGVFGTNDGNDINIVRAGTTVAVVTTGALVPPVDNTNSLGTAGLRWNLVRAVTVTTGDLTLEDPETGASLVVREAKEEGEDPSKVYVVNKVTGKKFELLMKEVVQ